MWPWGVSCWNKLTCVVYYYYQKIEPFLLIIWFVLDDIVYHLLKDDMHDDKVSLDEYKYM